LLRVDTSANVITWKVMKKRRRFWTKPVSL
jgi:hypothetical protein